jgi:outer membrane protein TolC
MASWSPFGGGSEIADRRTAQGRSDAALALSEAAEAGASLERQSTRTRIEVAIARLGIAETSVAQSVEAHRLVARKYDGGLATIAELLGAAALETVTRLDLSQARYQVIVADAELRRAAGVDLRGLTVLEN